MSARAIRVQGVGSLSFIWVNAVNHAWDVGIGGGFFEELHHHVTLTGCVRGLKSSRGGW